MATEVSDKPVLARALKDGRFQESFSYFSTNTMASGQKKTLTLGEKIEVIRRYEKGGVGQRRLAQDFGVGKTQILNIINRKREYIEDFENNAPTSKRRKVRQTGNEGINKLSYEFFCDMRQRCVPVNGPMLQEQALKFAEQLGVENFKASTGWLDSFKKRHNIGGNTMVGESAGVDPTVVQDWKEKLPHIIAGYPPENIYNMDESGLEYRTTSKKTLDVKGQQCSGGKQAKDRITIALCASMAGEKEKPLVIGKSAKPRCFKNVKVTSLPVTYNNNRKAWMTSDLFVSWLKKFDQKMGSQKRKILLLLDNAPSHADVQLRNIELKFFPPNTTSKLQPMDQGVIQTVKLKYRKRQLRRILQDLEDDKEATGMQVAKRLTILEAIQFLASAWQETTPETIQKCFRKAGFCETPAPNAETEPESETEDQAAAGGPADPPGMEELAQELFGCNLEELATIDEDLATCDTEAIDWEKDANTLLGELQDNDDKEDSEDEGEVESSTDSKIKNLNTLVSLMKDIKHFCAEEGLGDILNIFHQADDMLSTVWSERQHSARQTKISDFFKTK